MTFVLPGLLGAVLAFALVALAERRQRAGFRGADGWTVLTPGWLIKVAILLCAVLTALIATFFLIGGSTRPDAATQDLYAAGLLAVFAAGTVYLLWSAYARTIAWKDGELRIRNAFGGATIHRLADVKAAERLDARSEYRFAFSDGASLSFSVYFNGARELIDLLPAGTYCEPREVWR